jgi:hypothetical protein
MERLHFGPKSSHMAILEWMLEISRNNIFYVEKNKVIHN